MKHNRNTFPKYPEKDAYLPAYYAAVNEWVEGFWKELEDYPVESCYDLKLINKILGEV